MAVPIYVNHLTIKGVSEPEGKDERKLNAQCWTWAVDFWSRVLLYKELPDHYPHPQPHLPTPTPTSTPQSTSKKKVTSPEEILSSDPDMVLCELTAEDHHYHLSWPDFQWRLEGILVPSQVSSSLAWSHKSHLHFRPCFLRQFMLHSEILNCIIPGIQRSWKHSVRLQNRWTINTKCSW